MKLLTAKQTDGELIIAQKGITLIFGNGKAAKLLDSAIEALAATGDDNMVDMQDLTLNEEDLMQGYKALQANKSLSVCAHQFQRQSEHHFKSIEEKDGKLFVNTREDDEYKALPDIPYRHLNHVKYMLEPAIIKEGTVFHRRRNHYDAADHLTFWLYMESVHKHTNNNIIVSTIDYDCVKSLFSMLEYTGFSNVTLVRIENPDDELRTIDRRAQKELLVAKAILGLD